MSGMNNEVLQIVRPKSWIDFEPPRIKPKPQIKTKPFQPTQTPQGATP